MSHPDTISRVRPDDTDDDGERADLASDAFRIGIDTDGQDHIFSRIRNAVTVLNDGETVRTQSLADCRLSDWLSYIDERRGWNSTRVDDWYIETFPENDELRRVRRLDYSEATRRSAESLCAQLDLRAV